jgi:hypothetical protein
MAFLKKISLLGHDLYLHLFTFILLHIVTLDLSKIIQVK